MCRLTLRAAATEVTVLAWLPTTATTCALAALGTTFHALDHAVSVAAAVGFGVARLPDRELDEAVPITHDLGECETLETPGTFQRIRAR